MKSCYSRMLPVLILLAAVLLPAGCSKPRLKPEDLLLSLKNESEIARQTDLDRATYLDEQARMQRIADYLQAEEDKVWAMPVIFFVDDQEMINRIEDQSVRQDILDLLQQGSFIMIGFGNGDSSVRFYTACDSQDYWQGIVYFPGEEISEMDRSEELNRISHHEALADHWYLYHTGLSEIKNAEKYRKAAWDLLDEDGQKRIIEDWSQATVTLVRWEDVGKKFDKHNREFVVCVYLKDELLGVLGPGVFYLDPDTFEYIGTESRA